MNRVRVGTPTVDGNELVGEIATAGSVGRFFSGKPFRATYSTGIESVPESLRPIPVLAHVCPVAWATGADVVVDRVDARFRDALREIRTRYTELYPEFMTGGSVYCPNPVQASEGNDDAASDGEDESGMLFTGGVDSTATYVRHREEEPTLISVRGWVIGENDRKQWDRTRRYVRAFADERDLDAAFVESNMLSFLEMPLLQAHFQQYLDGAWYSSVGHGPGLLGLCAPLASTDALDRLYIAATHTEDWGRPWGSRPDLDEKVRWTGTDAVHDGYELTRQDKIDRIVEYAEAEAPELPLRTCVYDDAAGNCSDCEKCYRTIIGLLLADRDPNRHGYEFDAGTFREIRQYFESGESYLSPTTKYHWGVLQETAADRSLDHVDDGEAFRQWLLAQDFASFVDDSERSLQHRVLQRVARNTPTSVYSALYPVYRRVKSTPH